MPLTTDGATINGDVKVTGTLTAKALKVDGGTGRTQVVPFMAKTNTGQDVMIKFNFVNGLFTGATVEVDS